MRTEISSNGEQLRLIFTPDEIEAVRKANEDDNLTEDELLEHWLANSEFQRIGPEVCGDLTDAPIFAICGEDTSPKQAESDMREGWCLAYFESEVFDVSVHVTPVLARWGWMHYQVQSMVEAVLQDGQIVLTGGVAPKVLDRIVRLYPSAKIRFRIETPDGGKFAAYDLQRGPYMTGNPATAYCWDDAETAEDQRPLYERSLSTALVVRPYESHKITNNQT